jgi:aminopeptidase N
VAVVTGAGDEDFCCGGDLGGLIPLWTGAKQAETELEKRLVADPLIADKVMLKSEPVYKPIIAAVNGRALGGGTELLQATDIRVAADHAQFALPEPKSGVVPGAGSMVRLSRQLPWAHAMKILMSGEMISAQEALAMGLVSEVVPANQLRARAEELADNICKQAPLALQAIKRTALETHTQPWAEAFHFPGPSRKSGSRISKANNQELTGNTMRSLLIIVGMLILAACSADSDKATTPSASQHSPRAEGGFLTREEAAYRAGVVSNPHYRLAIELDETGAEFLGEAEINFDYRGDGSPLTIDFRDGEVRSLRLNGADQAFEYKGDFITLPGGSLEQGSQRLEIGYTHPYSQDGSGLYRYQDPEDGRIYMYTDFEPYDANRLFPHFDQPDLKSSFTLTVDAPAHWQVISTTRETAVREEAGRKTWEFPTSELMSSYIFSLHAGEYAVFEDPDFRYPLRLFSRQSMADYVPAEDWFKLTRQGFDYFDDYFDLPYPFKKYDQVIVPDYNSGAMENIAAVTFSETYLSRGEITRRELMHLGSVIMHEMAHMWFGDITTMAWWNGLWLNESFATVMADLALASATEYKEAWHEFFIGNKQWAYWEDQLVTTHPIELPVATTDDAFTNFDGITYGKGGSVLKQLIALLGEETFRQGIRDYLAANAWSNTELEDFIGALAQAADRDLEGWTQRWLYQAGLNSIEVRYSCEGDVIASMELVQSAPEEYPVLREQRTQLALYALDGNHLALQRVVPILFEGERTAVKSAIGAPCPDLVYPNHEDWAYIKVALDARSIETARHHINGLIDPLQRTMIWYDLYSMVTDGKLPLTDYLDILAANLPQETDLNAASDLLYNLRSAFSYLRQVPGGMALLPDYAARFEPLLWRLVEASDSDARQLWLSAYIDTANNDTAWQRLEALLKGELKLAGFELDQDQRWQVLRKLSEYQRPGHEALVAAELKRDASSMGENQALVAGVLSSNPEEKFEWLQSAVARDENYKLQRSRHILEGLYPYSSQRQLIAPYAEEILEMLPELDARHDVVFHDRVTSQLMPRLCSEENVQRLKAAAERYADLNPAIVKGLKINAQMDERCVGIGQRLVSAGAIPAP